MSEPRYWLSASVLTTTSAPSFSAASSPAWKPAARPLLFVRRTMWSTPCSRATSIVRSVEPSSMTSHSTASKPGTSRGRSASVAGRVSSSFRQGIWTMSFITRPSAAGWTGEPRPVAPCPAASRKCRRGPGRASRRRRRQDPRDPARRGRRRRARILDGGTPHAAHRHRSAPPRARRSSSPSEGSARSARTRSSGPCSSATARSWARAGTTASAARTPRSRPSAPAGGADLRGATLYVSLEPCCHHGPHAALHRRDRSRPASAASSSPPTTRPRRPTAAGLGILRDEGVEVDVADGALAGAARLRQPALPQARPHRAALGRCSSRP